MNTSFTPEGTTMSDACKFSTYGYACGKPVEHGRYLCEEHSSAKCRSCGQPATHGCDFCGQFVCGMPLCDECTYGADESKSSGSWGFLNHIHVSKPEFSDKHENRRLREELAGAIEERDRLREALRRQSDNMAFVINHHSMHGSWYEKFQRELEEDRAALNPTGAS
jgi:hypothetical protein